MIRVLSYVVFRGDGLEAVSGCDQYIIHYLHFSTALKLIFYISLRMGILICQPLL